MAKKKAFVIRIQREMMEAMEKWAADEFRSVNGQIEYLLNEALKKSGRKKRKVDSEQLLVIGYWLIVGNNNKIE